MDSRRLVHIVDDEDAIRRSASFMLKTSGFAVETWASGVAFLNEVRHAEIGCVLEDNQGMVAIADAIESKVNREYAIYARDI